MNDNSFVQKLIALEVALNDGKSLGDGLADVLMMIMVDAWVHCDMDTYMMDEITYDL